MTVDITSVNVALAGIVFNVLLIARAPLQLFQAIQTSLLPHLTGLEATEGHEAFARAIRTTVLAIAAFAVAVAIGLLAIGPPVMKALFGQSFEYGRVGLALIGLGMGMHLTSGALNQAALARNEARRAATCWIVAAVVFVAWMLTPLVSEELLRTEIGYLGATSLLALMLGAVYRRGRPAPQTARRGLHDRSVGLGGVRRPEDRRAGDEEVHAGGAAAGRGDLDRPRRPPRSRHRWPTMWRSRSIFSSECSMNACPPQPGLTDMHSARSIAWETSATAPDGRCRVDRDANRRAALTHEARGVGNVRAWPRRGR